MTSDSVKILADAFADAIDRKDASSLLPVIERSHASDVAAAFSLLDDEDRHAIVDIAGEAIPPKTLLYFDGDVLLGVAEALGQERFSRCVGALTSDEAVSVLEELPEDECEQALARLRRTRFLREVRQGLSYPEDSVGRLMNRDVVHIPEYWTVGQAVDYMRSSVRRPDLRFYYVYLADPTLRPVGFVSPAQILCAARTVPLKELRSEEPLHPVDPNMDQEEAAHVFRRYGLAAAPVIDERGVLIGEVGVDRILDVIDEEAQEDIMHLGGVNDSDLYRSPMNAVKSRAPWLAVNLLTTVGGAWVISSFRESIQHLSVLAVLLPVIACLAGNAGTQALTVVVRALSLRELSAANIGRTLKKEFLVGCANGALLSVLAGGAAAAIYGDMALGGVFAVAICAAIGVSGVLGALIPIGLDKCGVDPAIASSVFLIAITDALSFAFLLAGAYWALL